MNKIKYKNNLIIIGVLLIFSFTLFSNTPLGIIKTDQPPRIDGKLDDAVWKTTVKFIDFKTFKPDFGKKPSQKTVAYMTYDSENFYFAFRCYDKDPEKIKASVTKRDNMFGDDWVGIILDTFNDQQSGFAFLLNPLGIQGDGMMSVQGDLDESPDMVWQSKGTIDKEGYVVEFKIPLRSLRFPGKKNITMGVMFFRTIVRSSEQASFPEFSPDRGGLLTQSQLISLSDIKYKRVVEMLPAFTYSGESIISEGELKPDNKETGISLTAKVGVTSDITLDGAYNPDFSQVEADAGQIDINLRYNLFFPEKRPFFLEGKENFNFSGNTEEAPLRRIVHTRNIIDPIFGLKLSGRFGRKTTFTTLYAIDESPGAEKDEEDNFFNKGKNAYFSIFRFRHALKKDNYIGAFFTGRDLLDGYNRVLGSDGRFRFSVYSLIEYHIIGSVSKELDIEQTNLGHALGLRFNHSTRKVNFDIGFHDISKDFRIDTGFLTRKNISRFAAFGMYTFYPKSKLFQRIEPFYWSFHIYEKESKLFETFNLFTLRFWMPHQTQFRLDLIAANEVFSGERFNRNGIGFQSSSQITKHFFFALFYRFSQAIYYDPDEPYQGKSNRLGVSLVYQPLEKFSTELSLSYADFSRATNSEKVYDYILIRNRSTFQLNKYLFFRGIIEYNTYWEKLTVDFLASFTYIPGTVIHLGYGSIFEKIKWENREYVSNDRFLESKRGLFFKASYLWRL